MNLGYHTNVYQYDKLGNQLFTNQNGINEFRELNLDNSYARITDTIIDHDSKGNVTKYNDKEFVYDYLNRLIELKEDGNTIATYTYDASNRRVSKTLTSSSITTTYIYNNNKVIQEYENNSLTNSYIYASYIDDPIAYIYNNNTYYYVKDRQYSIQAITDSLGNIVESYSYNSFGIMTMKNSSQNVIAQSNVNNTITFTGRRYDAESGLYYYRNRMYSAQLGRFISKDPKGYVDGMNLYAYVKNNPLKYLDAFGTTAIERFDGGYVSYSISGKTDDFTVNYDNGSGFGNSESTNYSHDNSGQYTTQNTVSGMSNANWDGGSYQEFNNGIGIYKENGSTPVVFNPSLDAIRREGTANLYATQSTRVLPSEYEQRKAASAEFSNLSGALSTASALTRNSIILSPLSTPLGIAGSIAGGISYAYNPDKNINDGASQVSNNGLDMFQNRSK